MCVGVTSGLILRVFLPPPWPGQRRAGMVRRGCDFARPGQRERGGGFPSASQCRRSSGCNGIMLLITLINSYSDHQSTEPLAGWLASAHWRTIRLAAENPRARAWASGT
jgi:hypothetical protein